MTSGKRLLFVDDDVSLREMLVEQLQLHEEFTIVTADTGAAALERAKADYFDIIILDVGLPDMDGREVCRLMRRAGIKAPIIMLTGADTEADTILGLDAGANDYVTKPFRLGVLLARLRAHIRQHERSDDAVFTIGPYSFQPSAKLLVNYETNKKIRLTMTYPMAVGRNFDEILRVIDALQCGDANNCALPADWRKGDDVIIPPSISNEDAKGMFPNGWNEIRPYLRTTKL
jgi:CheY-like chemotaxis protein